MEQGRVQQLELEGATLTNELGVQGSADPVRVQGVKSPESHAFLGF